MVHPWCQDVPRDEAVRAAENAAANERPTLPDHRDLPERVARLEAAVEAMRSSSQTNHPADADGVSPRSAPLPSAVTRGEGIGGAHSGLRTERVTLEIVHRSAFHAAEWAWASMLELRRGESVRVVPSSEASVEVEG